MEPQIQYARTTDGVSIAYYTIGEGPAVLYLSLPSSHLEVEWKIDPLRVAFMNAAQRSTFIRLDFRGFGLSERNVDDFSPDAMVKDIEAVVERVQPESVRLYALAVAAPLAVAYAARHPDRVTHLVQSPAAVSYQDMVNERLLALAQLARVDWKLASETFVRSFSPDFTPELIMSFAELLQASVGADQFIDRVMPAMEKWDLDEQASEMQTPTLLIHSRRDPNASMEATRRVAGLIPNAKVVFVDNNFEGAAHAAEFFYGPQVSAERRTADQPARASSGTAIILFADIVDSTGLTEQLGDSAFREKARDLDSTLRTIIREQSGTPIEGKLLGDGVLATFASARQAIEAALACGKAGDEGGLPLHLGLHAGDVIREEGNVFGGAVNIAARVAGESAAGEVLVSQTVRELARTSAGVSFEDRGERELKGVGEPVRVWAVNEEKASGD